ncbi:histidine kinase [Ginsengibacter hankyongi]|uniref:Histidine kinase n=1 Tax=Ginsengibacter hankyongi TaxID=2607284 RepID=A0A5J5IEI5_9BACT|nr:sensor histidine kinase [Ginsengibacter hankyongi]KAA9037258.1 histidine kinase [Ginsengibacter hankyongi]
MEQQNIPQCPVSVISVYVSIYILLPRYILRGKYVSLLLITAGLSVIYFLLAWLITVLLARLTTNISYNELPVTFRWFQPVRYGIGLPLTSGVLTTIIMLFKNWHIEQKENEVLQRQKINTELLLLKTQFQPHFLYDALENIFFLVRKQSAESPGSVLKLSDLLSYILYEKDLVPVEKELDMMKAYLSLQKTFYPEVLCINFDQNIEKGNLVIAPLLLVSLIENCFERFLKTTGQKLNLNLNIKTDKRELYFQLECGDNSGSELKSINPDYSWITSLKRIELLYAGAHSFDMYIENGTSNILLMLELDDIATANKKSIKEPVLL